MTIVIRRIRRPLTALLAALALSACGDSATDAGDHADAVARIRLTFGASDVVVMSAEDGARISGVEPVVIGSATRAVTVEFLDGQGGSLNGELGDDFEARLVPANQNVITFTRNGAFSGTITRVGVGNVLVEVQLYHLDDDHEEFGFPLRFLVP